MPEERTQKRAEIDAVVRLRSPSVADFVEEHARDISIGGIFVSSPKPMPKSTLVKIEMEIDNETMVKAVGRVVWTRSVARPDHPTGMGIKFVRIDEAARDRIAQIVRERGSNEKSMFERATGRDEDGRTSLELQLEMTREETVSEPPENAGVPEVVVPSKEDEGAAPEQPDDFREEPTKAAKRSSMPEVKSEAEARGSERAESRVESPTPQPPPDEREDETERAESRVASPTPQSPPDEREGEDAEDFRSEPTRTGKRKKSKRERKLEQKQRKAEKKKAKDERRAPIAATPKVVAAIDDEEVEAPAPKKKKRHAADEKVAAEAGADAPEEKAIGTSFWPLLVVLALVVAGAIYVLFIR